MNFKALCEGYVEMALSGSQVTARRRIWPPNVHLSLGINSVGSPLATVRYDADGTGKLDYEVFGMNLIMNGETVIFGWCPSIEDVMGQDWELIRGRN